MTRRARLVLVLLAVLGVWAVGCAQGRDEAAWLAGVERAHQSADAAEKRGDVAGARDALRAAAQADVPGRVPDRDARVMRQDLYYRLALLELRGSAPEKAVIWADQGLSLGGAPRDVFVANLYIARGRAREARGDAVAAGRDYHEAIRISETLLDEALGGGEDRR
jgi:hypothetical protein